MADEPISEAEALSRILEWEQYPEKRDEVPGDSCQERVQYRVRVRRTIRRMISDAEEAADATAQTG